MDPFQAAMYRAAEARWLEEGLPLFCRDMSIEEEQKILDEEERRRQEDD